MIKNVFPTSGRRRRLSALLCSLALVSGACARVSDGSSAAPSTTPASTATQASTTTQPSTDAREGICSLDRPIETVKPSDEANVTLPAEGPITFDQYDFWAVHGVGTVNFNTQDYPDSLAALSKAADVAVRGKITRAKPGISMDEDYTTGNIRGVSLLSITGIDGKTYPFGLARWSGTPDCVLDKPLPDDEYVFLLTKDSTGQVPGAAWRCANPYCIVAAVPDKGAYGMLTADRKNLINVWNDSRTLAGIQSIWEFVQACRRG